MNIAIIVNSFPSLSEKFLLNQFAGLINENINIDIYASVKSNDTQVHDLYYKYNFDKYTYQVNIPRSLKERLNKLPKILLKNMFYSLKNTLRAFNFIKYQRAAKNLKTLYFLDAFQGKKYDIIHCQFGQNGFIGAFLKDCGFTNRLIVTFHGSDITVFPKKDGKNVYNYMFSRVDAVTAGTNFTAKYISEHGCPKEKIYIIPAGVLINKHHSINFKLKDANIILSVGRLEEVKGFEYAINAIENIVNDFPNINYFIVGNGSRKELLKNLIKKQYLDKNVFLLGEKNDTEIEELYKSASIFIAPSILRAS
ncbi:glycosyltransferase [Gracilinema caldarium]|uniref:glycosyltransferase n=1 Tax=Gracilinema caldarium TaxID=215591 RepID=UPI0002FECE67|nr:glycosyltransferase [Gracilinema caldarium]